MLFSILPQLGKYKYSTHPPLLILEQTKSQNDFKL